MFGKIKAFFIRYERYVSPVTLVTGFTFDSLMLRRIDVFFSNALLISYLVIAGISIIALNAAVSRQADQEQTATFHAILVFIMQFCFGGLFSASFLFYSRSGSFIASWPFLLLILAYMVGNEFFRKNYLRLGFQVSAFFSALFAYLIFFLPILLGRIDDSIFLLSGISALIITGLFVYVLSWFAAIRVRKGISILVPAIAGIFALINILYFNNLIPPIPLALRESGMYRSITAFSDGSYLLTGEKKSFWSSLFGDYEVHVPAGDPLYAWTAVFAPNKFATNIVHVWQYYDTAKKEWVTASRVYLAIIGGRDNGFRTYSIKDAIFPGKWRVNVETPRGQLIGRVAFDLSYSSSGEQLQRIVR